jgi:hypothetical protein
LNYCIKRSSMGHFSSGQLRRPQRTAAILSSCTKPKKTGYCSRAQRLRRPSRPSWRHRDPRNIDVENRKGLIGASLETGPVRDFTHSLGRGCLRLMSTGSITTHLAALVDGVILVVQPSFTPQQAAREAKDNIEAAGIERSGLRKV